MRKFFCLTAIILCIVILASCGVTPQPPKDDGELPDSPVTDNVVDKTDDGNKTDNDDKTDVKKVTYLSRATELVNNLEKVPGSAELFSEELVSQSSSVLNSSGPNGESGNVTDLTTPDSDFYGDSSWHHWIVPTQALSYDFLDGTIRFISEDIRSTVLDNVVQLDTWVQICNDSIKTHARLQYDVNSDSATLEYLQSQYDGKFFSAYYYKILSSYTSDGKTVIWATVEKYEKYDYHTITAHGKYSLKYVEDGQYMFSCSEPVYSTRGEVDEDGSLIIYEPTQTRILVVEKDLSDPFSEVIIKAVQATYPEIKCEFVDRRTFMSRDDDYRYTYNRGFYVSTLDGKPIFEINDYQLFINLYCLEGWDRCYVVDVNPELHERQTYVEIGGETYTNLSSAFFYTREESLLSTVSARIPYMVINLNLPEHQDKYAFYNEKVAELEEIMETYGLSFKKIDLADVSDRFKEYSEANDSVNAEEIFDTVSKMKLFDDLSQSEMMAMFEEEFVTLSEQKENDALYGIVEAVSSGSATCTQENALDFSDIAVTVKKSALLQKNAAYNLVFCLKSEFSTAYKTVSTCTFDGVNDMSLTFDEEFEFDFQQLQGGDYAVKLFVANENGLRISDMLDLNTQSDFVIEGTDFKIVSEKGCLKVCLPKDEDDSKNEVDDTEKLPDKEDTGKSDATE